MAATSVTCIISSWSQAQPESEKKGRDEDETSNGGRA